MHVKLAPHTCCGCIAASYCRTFLKVGSWCVIIASTLHNACFAVRAANVKTYEFVWAAMHLVHIAFVPWIQPMPLNKEQGTVNYGHNNA